jgi:uncharacterized protein
MPGELLLDTGALVSVLDRSQRDHRACVQVLERWKGPLVSSEAVLTEATHLLGRVRGGQSACLDFVLAAPVALVPSTPASLRRSRELIEAYANLPMDFADSTLVVLAEELGTDVVFTTDRRDFEVYRIGGRKRFGSFRPVPEVRQRKPGAIWRVSPQGTPTLVLHGPMPAGIELGPNGHLFVADRHAAQIFVVTADGKRVDFASFTEGDAPRTLGFVPVSSETRRAGIAGDLLVVPIRRGAWPVNEVLRISGPFEAFVRARVATTP